jgi:hypothetical protein
MNHNLTKMNFNMEWKTVFVDGFDIADFYEIVESLDVNDASDAQPKKEELRVEIPTPTSSSSKSPRRRTFGAQFQELKDEIANLRLEIEIRDAHIHALLHELKHKKTK